MPPKPTVRDVQYCPIRYVIRYDSRPIPHGSGLRRRGWGQSIPGLLVHLLYSSRLKHPASNRMKGRAHERSTNRLDCSHHHRRSCGLVGRTVMKSDMGLVMNIVLGVIGAAVASAIFSFFGINLGGWLGYLIAGFVGACLLIWIVRTVRGATA